MDSHSMPSACEHETALQESQELLAEVVASTDSESFPHRFAAIWSQLIELSRGEGDTPDSAMLLSGIDELRTLLEQDLTESDYLQTLLDESVTRWADQLTVEESWEEELDHSSHFEDASDESADESDVVAPDAASVQAMLEGLQSTSQELPGDFAHEQLSQEQGTQGSPNSENDSTGGSAQETVISSSESSRSQFEALDTLDAELKEAFLDDAGSCLASIEQAILNLESENGSAESVPVILRELHTLKGASASVGLSEIADSVHRWEDALRDAQTSGQQPSVDQLLSRLDAIRVPLGMGSESIAPSSAANSASTAAPSAASAPANQTAVSTQYGGDSPTSSPSGGSEDEPVRVRGSQLNRLMDMLAELVMLRNRRETEVQALQEAYHELISSVSKMRLLSHEEDLGSQQHSSLQLSEIANDVAEVAQSVRQCVRPVAEGNAAVSSFIRQFRQELVELRRSPIAGLVQRLQRSVRETANAEQKQVRLELIGQDAGIERSLQQRLYEPLLHIVRNSVCHGIETPSQREKQGKPAFGTITMRADSGPDLLSIEIQDDGAGLDYDAIRRRGIQQGLIASDRAASEHELSQLIFHPGFSTRSAADQNAGRGVGMDVVAATIQRLRGWVEIESTPGRGTKLRMSFPLPSLVQHAMVFRAGGQRFALPMQAVQRAGEIDGELQELSLTKLMGNGSASAASSESCQRIVLASDSAGSTARGEVPLTLLVDEILGPEEVVVRPLPGVLRSHPFVSGATLSGMGQVVLLVDVRRLVQTQQHQFRQIRAKRKGHPEDSSEQSHEKPRVLVADDSLSARKRVVRALNRFDVDVVEVSDGKQALDLIRVESFDALFSDMEMPHLSGMDLLNKIHGDAELELPVVIISSRDEPSFTDRARSLGAVDYLIKPLAVEDLDRTIQKITALKHLQPLGPESTYSPGVS